MKAKSKAPEHQAFWWRHPEPAYLQPLLCPLLRCVQLGGRTGGTWGQLMHSDGASCSRRGWFPFSYTRVLDSDGGDRLHMR